MAKQYDKKIELLFEGEVRDQIAIIGSSRSLYGLSPEVITDESGMSCYNFGFAGSNIRFHETIFNLIVANYQPEKLILVLDEDGTFVDGEKTIYRKDKIVPYLKYEEVLKEYCEHANKSLISSKICWTYRENQNLFDAIEYLKDGTDEPTITTDINEHGAIMFPRDSSIIEEDVPFQDLKQYDENVEEAHMLSSFRHIIEESKKLGIQVYVLRLPRFNTKLNGFSERLAEFESKPAVNIIDFSTAITKKEMFYDNGHLNELGAVEISKKLAQQLN